MKHDARSLSGITLFSTLPTGALAQLEQHSFIKSYAAGEYIQFEKDPAEGVFFIADGQVQILHTSAEGREQVLVTLGPGESFNMVPLLHPDQTARATVRALTDVQVACVPGSTFLQVLKNTPELSFAVLSQLAGKLTALTRLVEQLSLHSIRGRLARFLMEQADKGSQARHWTQDEMAVQLGTVRDVVGRTLRAFEEAGYVRRQQGRIVLLDRAALEAETEQ